MKYLLVNVYTTLYQLGRNFFRKKSSINDVTAQGKGVLGVSDNSIQVLVLKTVRKETGSEMSMYSYVISGRSQSIKFVE